MNGPGPENHQRRSVIRKLAVTSAALAGYSLLPDRWTRPIIEFGSLPAHAGTSGSIDALIEEIQAKLDEEQAEEIQAQVAEQPDAAPAGACADDFSLLFLMTQQACDSCGIWFDSAELVINHSAGVYRYTQNGSLLIKKVPSRIGTFKANLGSIPCEAKIRTATLYMHLNPHEGIANSDSGSVISVYDNRGGTRGDFLRYITASGDIKGKGYHKGNPVVPIDFTSFAVQVHGQ